jgi:hypothetical protein
MISKSISAIHPRLICLLICLVVVALLISKSSVVVTAQEQMANTEVVSPSMTNPCDSIQPIDMCIMVDGQCRTIVCPYPAPTPRPSPVPSPTELLGGAPKPGWVVISEYRLRGPNGPNDEFIELYNTTDWPITVSVDDGSGGWALAASDGIVRFIVPLGTVIPPRGHYLGVNSLGYSLGNYPAGSGKKAAGDTSYILDIPDGSGLALFGTANPSHFNNDTRVDAVGSTSSGPLYNEGGGYYSYGAETFADLDYSFFRNMSGNGLPHDTNNNSADFLGVDPDYYNTSLGQHLGAPGPENLSSPVTYWGSILASGLLDPSVAQDQPPNRIRNTTPDYYNNSPYGTLSFCRVFTNTSSNVNITRLRFRIIDVTTWPNLSGNADLRAREGYGPITLNNGSVIYPSYSYVESPPSQPHGGGYNSTITIPGVTPYSPLRPGQSITVKFTTGVVQTGYFRFYVMPELLVNEPATDTSGGICSHPACAE